MEAVNAGDGEGSGAECGAGSARQFAEEQLAEASEPVTPAGLRDEYGCSGGHMRSVLGDLVDEGEAERVGHGQYVASSDLQSHPEQDTEPAEGTAGGEGDERVSEAVEETADDTDDAGSDGAGGEESVPVEVEELESVDGGAWSPSQGQVLIAATAVVAVLVLLGSRSSGPASDGGQDGAEGDDSDDRDDGTDFSGWS